MPSPKHSASTGTQQPNTADSRGPSGLDFLTNFNAQIAFKSGKSTHHDPGISGKRAGNELSGAGWSRMRSLSTNNNPTHEQHTVAVQITANAQVFHLPS
jgi:DeoR/GlpR family transcriptional regulator of sugar metabolism